MRQDDQGWWFQNPYDKAEWYGPYDTKKEANEARVSFKRNYIGLFRPEQVCTK